MENIKLDLTDFEKVVDELMETKKPNPELKKLMRESSPMYQMIADYDELKWFFDHVIQRPQVNESYSAVFVSRHKKLTDEEAKQIGLTRKEGEFLSTVTFKLRAIKDASRKDDPEIWNFDNFVKTLRRFNVDKYAYTTALGEPIPSKTLAVIFYVNPGDDMKVCRSFVDEYNTVTEAISKAMLNGKEVSDNYQSFQWFGKAESTIKHLKANQKGSRYWLDFDCDVPSWFKADLILDKSHLIPYFEEVNKERKAKKKSTVDTSIFENSLDYYDALTALLNYIYGKGNYVVVDTSGGYHILVRTSAIKANPHDFCEFVSYIYKFAIEYCGEPEYLDENGVCKFECIVNDSQIPGLPLPGTYQYDRPVTVLNKEDFE